MVEHLNHATTLEDLSPERREMLQGFRELVAHELVVNRRSRKEVVERLVARGFPRTAVKQFVDKLAPNILTRDKKNRRKRYGKMMVSGFITMFFGIGATVLTYVLAIKLGGHTYLLFYGAIVSGLIIFVIGFISWLANQF